jgi:hypothetical protein
MVEVFGGSALNSVFRDAPNPYDLPTMMIATHLATSRCEAVQMAQPCFTFHWTSNPIDPPASDAAKVVVQ